MDKNKITPEFLAKYIIESKNNLELTDAERTELIQYYYKNQMNRFMLLVLKKALEAEIITGQKPDIVLTELTAFYADNVTAFRAKIEEQIILLASSIYKMSPLLTINEEKGTSSF